MFPWQLQLEDDSCKVHEKQYTKEDMASVNGVIATVEYYSEDKDYENWEVDQ